MTGRRYFVTTMCAVLAAPRVAGAQRAAKVFRVGVIAPTRTPTPAVARLLAALSDGLTELGYVEGKNIVFERRYYEGQLERVPGLAAELVRLNVDVIMVYTTPVARAVKAATSTIPILFITAIDPVGAGLAVSLARPGGNVTGLATLSPELSAKRLELIKELVPGISKVAVLWNAENPANAVVRRQLEEAARRTGLTLSSHEIRRADEFESKFAGIVHDRSAALLVPSDAFMFQHRDSIARFALQGRLPTFFEPREMVIAGGLIAYGPSYAEIFRRAAFYIDRLLKGVKPADLPFEQPTKFELVINMKTARALGLTIPPSLLLRADLVSE